MSGGYFDHDEGRIPTMAEEIKRLVNAVTDEKEILHEYMAELPSEIIDKFKEAQELLEKAYIYTKRIDRLISDDDGEESFLAQLEEDLKELRKKRIRENNQRTYKEAKRVIASWPKWKQDYAKCFSEKF